MIKLLTLITLTLTLTLLPNTLQCQTLAKLKKDSTYTIHNDSSYLVTKSDLTKIFLKYEAKLKTFKTLATANNRKATEVIMLYSKEISALKLKDSLLTVEYYKLQKLADSLYTTQITTIQKSKEALHTLTNEVEFLTKSLEEEHKKQLKRERIKFAIVTGTLLITNIINLILTLR